MVTASVSHCAISQQNQPRSRGNAQWLIASLTLVARDFPRPSSSLHVYRKVNRAWQQTDTHFLRLGEPSFDPCTIYKGDWHDPYGILTHIGWLQSYSLSGHYGCHPNDRREVKRTHRRFQNLLLQTRGVKGSVPPRIWSGTQKLLSVDLRSFEQNERGKLCSIAITFEDNALHVG